MEVEYYNGHKEESIDKEAARKDSPQIEMTEGIGNTACNDH